MKKILITGASGFIGGFMVEKARSEGFQVFAAVRRTSSLQYLSHPDIRLVELDLGDRNAMSAGLRALKDQHGKFDLVIHNAGVTKASRSELFFRVNNDMTRVLVESLAESGLMSGKFIFISSLAAAGPGEAVPGATISTSQEPRPVTDYGRSKLAAEEYLRSQNALPYIIIRPTAVFGPRDREFLTLFQLINRHLELYVGSDRQQLSFIYVKDLVDMLFHAALSDQTNKLYHIGDGNSYLVRDFVAAIRQAMGKRTLKLKVPVPLAAGLAFTLEKSMGLFGRVPMFNSEKMAELSSPNWVCDMSDYFSDFSLRPSYDLASAVRETLDWYRAEKWL